MTKKFPVNKGFHGFFTDDEEWLRPTTTDPFQASASGVGYNAKFDDDAGTRGHGQGVDGWGDNDQYMRESLTRHGDLDAPHERLNAILDGQYDQPAGKLLGGGGPVSDNKAGGVGPGKPRYAPKKSLGAGFPKKSPLPRWCR